MSMQLDGKFIRTYKKYIKMQVSTSNPAKLIGGLQECLQGQERKMQGIFQV